MMKHKKRFSKLNFFSADEGESKSNKIFFGAVVLAAIAGFLCFGASLLDTAKTVVTNGGKDIVDTFNEEIKPAIDVANQAASELQGATGGDTQAGLPFIGNAGADTSNTNVSSAEPSTPVTPVDEKIEVKAVRVVDGDTFVVSIDGKDTKIRLIGVDTPESVAPENYHKENTEEGAKVSEIVKSYIQNGDTLYLEYDVGRTDTYGRTLAYLYFENGTMVQDWLLMNGYAQVMTIQPNSKYANHFVELEQRAMTAKLGIWRDE